MATPFALAAIAALGLWLQWPQRLMPWLLGGVALVGIALVHGLLP